MGCDVHMFVEKYNYNTKSWEKVGKKFPDIYAVEKIIKFMILTKVLSLGGIYLMHHYSMAKIQNMLKLRKQS